MTGNGVLGRAALLLALLATVQGQSITLKEGSVGCISSLAPGAPVNLRAVPDDGKVTLTWSRPANGACVDNYVVSVVPVNAPLGRSAGTPPQQTSSFSVTIAQLENGVEYLFTVQAFSTRFNGGGEATVTATPLPPPPPTARCSRWRPVAPPTQLKATPGPGKVELCWGPPPRGTGCVSEYSVTVTELNPRSRTAGLAKRRVNSGGCITLEGLNSGSPYLFSVSSVGQLSNQESEPAEVQATPL